MNTLSPKQETPGERAFRHERERIVVPVIVLLVMILTVVIATAAFLFAWNATVILYVAGGALLTITVTALMLNMLLRSEQRTRTGD